MLEFIQEPLFIGLILGWVSAGLIVLMGVWDRNKMRRTAYFERVGEANIAVLIAIRAFVADNGLPDKKFLMGMINSNARKYNVEAEDMYAPYAFCEEVVKEMMEDVFVSGDDKRRYSMELMRLMEADKTEEIATFEPELHVAGIEETEKTTPLQPVAESVAF